MLLELEEVVDELVNVLLEYLLMAEAYTLVTDKSSTLTTNEHFNPKNPINTRTMAKLRMLYKLKKYLEPVCLILSTSSTQEMHVTSRQQIKQIIRTTRFVVKIWIMNGMRKPAKYPRSYAIY